MASAITYAMARICSGICNGICNGIYNLRNNICMYLCLIFVTNIYYIFQLVNSVYKQ